MRWFVIFILMSGISSCNLSMNESSKYRIFTHVASDVLRETNNIDASDLDDFRDTDIVIRVGFGKKADDTYILYVTPMSDKSGKSIYLDGVVVSSVNFERHTKLDETYSLDKAEGRLFSNSIRVMEDIDVNSIPHKKPSFTVKVTYKLEGFDKEMIFDVPATYYSAPIR